MSQRGKISVCMPTYNGARYIKEQLESILDQLNPYDEVIISDDRSTDNTIDIIKSFNDDRVKIFIHEKVKNRFNGTYKIIYYVYKNVENAISKASGEYIFLSDQDDVWLPNKIERVTAEFEKGVECVLHNANVVDNNMNVLMESFACLKPSKSLSRLLVQPFYQGAAMAFKRNVAKMALPFPNKFIVSHDHWIACVAWSDKKNISFIDQPLILYRRHGNNVSPSCEKSPNSLFFKISYRFNMVASYLKAKTRNNK